MINAGRRRFLWIETDTVARTMSTLAGDQVGAVTRDDVAIEAELNERIDRLVSAASVSTEPARRSLVP